MPGGSWFLSLVEKLLDAGINLIAAGGRQFPNMKKLLAPIADRIGFIAENGSLVAWKGKVLRTCTIPRELARELIRDMQAEDGAEVLVSCPDTGYSVPKHACVPDLLENKMHNVVAVLTCYEAIHQDILKIAMLYKGGLPEEAETRLHTKYDPYLTVVDAGNGWLDFIPKESGKGGAMVHLAEYAGFSLAETVSFGNSENDISMLELTGISYAMEHAKPAVKAVCAYRYTSVEDILEKGFRESNNELASNK